MHHGLIARRNDLGIAKSPFDRYSPRTWLAMPSTSTFRCACAPVNCDCPFFYVTRRCCRSSRETASSGAPIPRQLWSHPYHNLQLSRPVSPVTPPPFLLVRQRRSGFA